MLGEKGGGKTLLARALLEANARRITLHRDMGARLGLGLG